MVNSVRIPRSLDQVTSSQHERWRAGVQAVKRVPIEELWPGCISLAAIFDAEDFLEESAYVPEHSFIGADALQLMIMRTVKVGHFDGITNREVRLTSVVRPKMAYGGVVVDSREAEMQFDFRRCPFDKLKQHHRVVTAGTADSPDTLNSEDNPRLFTIANCLVENANSTGMKFRGIWRARAKQSEEGAVLCGDGLKLDRVPNPEAWMPVPYVTIPEGFTASRILAESTVHGVLSAPIRRAFVREVSRGMPVHAPLTGKYLGSRKPRTGWERDHCLHHVFADGDRQVVISLASTITLHRKPGEPVRLGDEVGFAAPEVRGRWKKLRPDEQWFRLREEWSQDMLQFLLAYWVSDQAKIIGDKFAIPFHFMSVYSTLHRDACQLVAWDVRPTLDYVNAEAGVPILPGLRQRSWDDLQLALPWDMRLDAGDRRILRNPQKRKPAPSVYDEPKDEGEEVPVNLGHVALALPTGLGDDVFQMPNGRVFKLHEEFGGDAPGTTMERVPGSSRMQKKRRHA